MQMIAIRRYPIEGPRTGCEYQATDYLYRRRERFYLRETTNGHPDERDRTQRVGLGYVYRWLSEIPEQIERVVIEGGLARSGPEDTDPEDSGPRS